MKYPEGGTVIKDKKINGITYTIREEDYYKNDIKEALCTLCDKWKNLEEFVKCKKNNSFLLKSNSCCKDCKENPPILDIYNDDEDDDEDEGENEDDNVDTKQLNFNDLDLLLREYNLQCELEDKMKEAVWNKRYGKKSKICKCALCNTILKYKDHLFGIAFKRNFGIHSDKMSSYDIVCSNCEDHLESTQMGIEEYQHFIHNEFKVVKMDEEVKSI